MDPLAAEECLGGGRQMDRKAIRTVVLGLADCPTRRTGEPVRPSQTLTVLRAGAVVGKDALELGKSRREAAEIYAQNLTSLWPDWQ